VQCIYVTTSDQVYYRQIICNSAHNHTEHVQNTCIPHHSILDCSEMGQRIHRQLSVQKQDERVAAGAEALIRFPLVRNRRQQTNPAVSSTCLSEPTHHAQRKRLWKFLLSIPPRASESSYILGRQLRSRSSMLQRSSLLVVSISGNELPCRPRVL
jgi:hypothetical protein